MPKISSANIERGSAVAAPVANAVQVFQSYGFQLRTCLTPREAVGWALAQDKSQPTLSLRLFNAVKRGARETPNERKRVGLNSVSEPFLTSFSSKAYVTFRKMRHCGCDGLRGRPEWITLPEARVCLT